MFTNVGRWVKAANESFSFIFFHKWLNVVNEERFGQKKNERKRFPQRIIQICNEFETKKKQQTNSMRKTLLLTSGIQCVYSDYESSSWLS